MATEEEKRLVSCAKEVQFALTASSDIGANNVVVKHGVNMESRKAGAFNVEETEFAFIANCERVVEIA